jgi:hypothetical protein
VLELAAVEAGDRVVDPGAEEHGAGRRGALALEVVPAPVLAFCAPERRISLPDRPGRSAEVCCTSSTARRVHFPRRADELRKQRNRGWDGRH